MLVSLYVHKEFTVYLPNIIDNKMEKINWENVSFFFESHFNMLFSSVCFRTQHTAKHVQ